MAYSHQCPFQEIASLGPPDQLASALVKIIDAFNLSQVNYYDI
jgi:hypothetical protein